MHYPTPCGPRRAFAVSSLAALLLGSAATSASPPIVLPDPSPDPYGSIGTSALIAPRWLIAGASAKRFLTPQKVLYSYGALLLWPRTAAGDPEGPPTVVWPLSPVRASRFGEAIAMSDDRLLVGEPGYFTSISKRAVGRAQIVDLSLPSPAAVEIIAAPAGAIGTGSGFEFGTAVALDGSTAVITALGYGPAESSIDVGAAFVFQRSDAPEGAPWTLQWTLTPPEIAPGQPDGAMQGFGSSVALSDEDVLVGAPSALATADYEHGRVYRFDRATGLFDDVLTAPTPELGDRFGARIVQARGLLAVAAPGDACGLGVVHLFRHGPKGWNHEATLLAPGEAIDGWTGFGHSIAIDRERVAVGTGGIANETTFGHRSAIYRRTGAAGSTTWVLEAVIDGDASAPTGAPVAIDAAGFLSGEAAIGLGQMRYQGGAKSLDLDFDGTVGPGDLAVLLGAWGSAFGAPADLNGDGQVDPTDLAMLLGGWS